MNKLIMTFLCLISFNIFSTEIIFNKFVISGNEIAKPITIEINKSIKEKRYFSWEKAVDSKELVKLNGVEIIKIVIGENGVYKAKFSEDLNISKLFIPAPSVISFLDGELMIINTELTGKVAVSDGVALKQGVIIADKSGRFLGGVSETSTLYRDKRIFKNDILTSDKDGVVIAIRDVMHYGKKYNLSDYQIDNAIPIESVGVGANENIFVTFNATSDRELLGNSCRLCGYTLCLKGNSFFVYMISNANFRESKIQGKILKEKKQVELYYTSGDSTSPIVRNLDDDIPFTKTCSFEPFKG